MPSSSRGDGPAIPMCPAESTGACSMISKTIGWSEESSTPPLFEHAHNDYLEYLAELGGMGFLLLLGGILTMLVFSFLMWRVRRHPEVKGLVLGGMVAVVAMLIHSITDFNLHIPANMMLFALVLSLTIAAAFYRRNQVNRL